MDVTKHLVIDGKVQGVGFRAWLVSQAESRGVHGWVKNRSDGLVEATLHGPEEKVDAVVNECYKGPAAADVSEIVASDTYYEGPALFEIHSTD